MNNFDAATYDLLGMIEDHPVTATWEGADYEGTTGGIVTSQELEPGGFLEDYDFKWVTSLQKRAAVGVNELVDRFPGGTPPAVGDDITINEVDYRVVRLTKDDFGAGIEFALRTVNK
jgi:hypothetical protein